MKFKVFFLAALITFLVPVYSQALPSGQAVLTDVNKSYYMLSVCREAESCPEGYVPGGGLNQKFENEEYEDLLIYLGDPIQLPLRALLPYKDSAVKLKTSQTTYQFKGTMIVCLDYDPLNRKWLIKILQGGKVATNIEYHDGHDYITFTSGNEYGIRQTSVDVAEGSVQLETPWVCSSCFETKQYVLGVDDCRYVDNSEDRETSISEFVFADESVKAFDTAVIEL